MAAFAKSWRGNRTEDSSITQRSAEPSAAASAPVDSPHGVAMKMFALTFKSWSQSISPRKFTKPFPGATL
jgi:hypothetical protein